MLLLSCCCDSWLCSWAGWGEGFWGSLGPWAVSACSQSYVRSWQYPLSFSFLLPLLLNVSHPLCLKAGVGTVCDCGAAEGRRMRREEEPSAELGRSSARACRDGETGEGHGTKSLPGFAERAALPCFCPQCKYREKQEWFTALSPSLRRKNKFRRFKTILIC